MTFLQKRYCFFVSLVLALIYLAFGLALDSKQLYLLTVIFGIILWSLLEGIADYIDPEKKMVGINTIVIEKDGSSSTKNIIWLNFMIDVLVLLWLIFMLFKN